MDWSSFLSGLIGAGFGSTFVGIILNLWLEHKLSIERKNLFDKIEFKQKQREASKAIVDILAEWIRPSYVGSNFPNEDRWKLQKIYWEYILLLDKDLFELLSSRLANAPTAVDTNELIVQSRKVLLNLNKPDIRAEQLNTWAPLSPIEPTPDTTTNIN
jgi:hypothetical protein